MKQSVLILLCVIFIGSFPISAQDIDTTQIRITSIFDHLDVRQSVAIRNLVGVRLKGENVVMDEDGVYLKIQGFRTQVFSGNDQRLSKKEAFDKEQEIKELYPDLVTYVTYKAPFWKLRVGDFRTHEEAYAVLRQLKEAFPSFGKEMYIVKDEIRMPLDK